MTGSSVQNRGDTTFRLRTAALVALAGVLTLLIASMDPRLLVMMAVVTVAAVTAPRD